LRATRKHDFHRGQPLGEAHALLHRLGHFLVVERVARRLGEAAAIGDGGAAPALEQVAQARRAPLGRGARALVADRAAMRKEFRGDLGVLARKGQRRAFGRERVVARREFLHLTRVIGERLGRRVDRGQPAADHDDRHAQLQIGDRLGLGGAGQLQRHQEIGGLAHAARQPVLHLDHRRTSRPHAQRDMVEAHLPGVVERQRPAEAHAAMHRERRAPFQQQPDEFQEVLVPAHGDPVLGHAAETGEHARVQVLAQRRDVADRREGRARASRTDAGHRGVERLDFQPVDPDHRMAVVEQVMRQRVSGRAHAHHQHLAAAVGARQRTPEVEGVPARQQRVDLEAPGQRQDVLEHARLGLRNVDRFLLLVDAGLHAVVADAVPGARAERIVDRDRRQRRHRVAARAQRVHLADLLFQRTARERDAVLALLEGAGLAVLEPLGAGILPLRMAPDAVVDLIERMERIHAGIGEGEGVALAPVMRRQAHHRDAVPLDALHRHEARGIDPARRAEQHAGGMFRAPGGRQGRPGRVALRGRERRRVRALVGGPAQDVPGEGRLGERFAGRGFERRRQRRSVERGGGLGLVRLQGATLHEAALRLPDRVEAARGIRERAQLGADAEQHADEALERRAEIDDKPGFVERGQGLGRGARRQQPVRQTDVMRLQPVDEGAVEPHEALPRVQIGEGQPEGEIETIGHRVSSACAEERRRACVRRPVAEPTSRG
jgi:hypothetical protein